MNASPEELSRRVYLIETPRPERPLFIMAEWLKERPWILNPPQGSVGPATRKIEATIHPGEWLGLFGVTQKGLTGHLAVGCLTLGIWFVVALPLMVVSGIIMLIMSARLV